jgi:hypothetical protein
MESSTAGSIIKSLYVSLIVSIIIKEIYTLAPKLLPLKVYKPGGSVNLPAVDFNLQGPAIQ